MCVAKGTTSLQRIQQITPPPIIVAVVTWADCLVAMQQRQVDAVCTDDSILAGLVVQDPYLHIVGPSMNEEPYGIGINLQNTGLVRFVNGTLERIRRDGTWTTLVPQVVDRAGPGAGTPGREVFGLMAEVAVARTSTRPRREPSRPASTTWMPTAIVDDAPDGHPGGVPAALRRRRRHLRRHAATPNRRTTPRR